MKQATLPAIRALSPTLEMSDLLFGAIAAEEKTWKMVLQIKSNKISIAWSLTKILHRLYIGLTANKAITPTFRCFVVKIYFYVPKNRVLHVNVSFRLFYCGYVYFKIFFSTV